MPSDSLTLDGRQIELRSGVWPLRRLRLDVRNPRLVDELRQKGISKPSEKQLEDMIYAQDDTKALIRSIESMRGLVEPLWITPDGVVKEGNRRLVSLRRLAVKDPAYGKVIVKVLPPDLSDKEIRLLLAVPHVVGRKPWLTVAQARTLFEMNTVDNMPMEELAQKLGMSKTTVKRRIDAYRAHNQFLQVAGDIPENVRKFSFFEELEKQKNLRNLREDDPSFMPEFISWVKNGKLKDARHVRDLPEIVDNDEAKTEFREHGYQAAMRVLAQHDPSVDSRLYQRMDQFTQMIEYEMSNKEISDLKSDHAKQAKWRKLVRAIIETQENSGVQLIDTDIANT